MRRGRIFIYLALIIILGLAAVVVVYQFYLAPSGVTDTLDDISPTPEIRTVDVVVVAQRIPRGTTLSATVLSLIPIQEELLFGEMFTNISDVEGKLAKFDLEAGIPLTRGMLVDSGEQLSATGSVAALLIPRGMVAISIPTNRLASVSYAPKSGDHVNVIATMLFADLDSEYQSVLPNRNVGVIGPGTGEGSLSGSASMTEPSGEEGGEVSGGTAVTIQTSSIVAVSGGGGSQIGRPEVDPILAQTFYVVPSEAQRPRMVSQNLLQDAIVLQVGDFPFDEKEERIEPEAVPTEEIPEEEQVQTAPKPPDVISLIVSPQDAITLNYLVYSGAQLTLALRPADDDSRIQTESVTLQFLLERYNISVPARLPTGMEPPVRRLVSPKLRNDIVPTPAP